MPSPFVPQTVTITDFFHDGAGNPHDGRCEFRPSVTAKTPDGTITRNPIIARLVGGHLTVVLIAPNSTGVTPQGWTYEVTVITGPPGSSGALGVDAWVREVYNISLDAGTPAVTLRDLTKVDAVGDSQFEVKSVAGVFPGLDGNVALTASDLTEIGAGYATQVALDAVAARTTVLEDHPPNHATRHAPGGADPLDGSYVAVSRINAINGVPGLDGDGKINSAQLPSIAISDFLGDVANEAAMLALVGQRGDWANRTDSPAGAWLVIGEPTSSLVNWKRMSTPADAVLSVAGKTGTVTLVKADVGLSNVDNTTDVGKPVSTLQAAAIALQIPLTQRAAASGVATLDGSTKIPIAQIPTGTSSTTVAIGNDARLSDARTPVAHVHAIADVTNLQTQLDDQIIPSTDSAILGDFVSSIPRFAASSSDTLGNGFLSIYGSLSLRSSFIASKVRFHVKTVLGSPGIVTYCVYKGSNRTNLTKVVPDTTITSSFGTLGLKELAITPITIARNEWVYLAFLHTNAGTDPSLATPPVSSVDLLNPTAAQTLVGFKSGQALPLPTTLDVSASFSASSRIAWFALAV